MSFKRLVLYREPWHFFMIFFVIVYHQNSFFSLLAPLKYFAKCKRISQIFQATFQDLVTFMEIFIRFYCRSAKCYETFQTWVSVITRLWKRRLRTFTQNVHLIFCKLSSLILWIAFVSCFSFGFYFYLSHILIRSPGTTSVCFSAVTVNDEHKKPEFKIKRRG